MAADRTPDDAVRAIQALTRVLETTLARLTELTSRSERLARWHGALLTLVLLLTGAYCVPVSGWVSSGSVPTWGRPRPCAR